MRNSTKRKDAQRSWSGKVQRINVGTTEGYVFDHLHECHADDASTLDIVRPKEILKRIHSRRRRSGKQMYKQNIFDAGLLFPMWDLII